MIITEKRIISAFAVLALCSICLILRIAAINTGVYSDASSDPSARVFNISSSRGMIYDRNMTPLVYTSERIVLAVNPTEEAAEALKSGLNEEDYTAIADSLAGGKPFTASVVSYSGECDDVIPLSVYDRYSENDSAVHITGYLNGEGVGASGIEKAFDSLLSENSGSLSVRFMTDAAGYALDGEEIRIVDENYMCSAGVVLTVDSDIQRICENALNEGNIERGCVIVLSAETSEILAMASVPVFDRTNLSESLNDEGSPFLNRCLNSYAVGSIFKPVVAAAALESGISENTVFECGGGVTLGSVTFGCHNKSGHGVLTMGEAMAVSCNAYYISLGLETGAENILKKASEMGLGKEIALADACISSAGNLPTEDDIDSVQALANLSFGQGTLLASPLQIAAMYCVFANGGYYREPYILKSIVNSEKEETAYYKNEINDKVLSDEICGKIREMLKETVENGSGSQAKPYGGTASGKTATAQTGRYDGEEEIVHTWFAGYFPSDEPEYVIVVFNENGSSSSTDCAPVFRTVAEGIDTLDYIINN
ncbi:MAG: penicillin-binding protein 2 [Clostridiales bacterium]|nr:penicillin-binding protein 2 [Clostridiales bacterium]